MTHETYYCDECNFAFSWREGIEDIHCSFCNKDCIKISEPHENVFYEIMAYIKQYKYMMVTLSKINKSRFTLEKDAKENSKLIKDFDVKQEKARTLMAGFLINLD